MPSSIKRLDDHNAGISTFTSKANDWIIKYKKAFNNRADAMQFEKYIKKMKSRKYIEALILSNG